jgi:hypothetical protein
MSMHISDLKIDGRRPEGLVLFLECAESVITLPAFVYVYAPNYRRDLHATPGIIACSIA